MVGSVRLEVSDGRGKVNLAKKDKQDTDENYG